MKEQKEASVAINRNQEHCIHIFSSPFLPLPLIVPKMRFVNTFWKSGLTPDACLLKRIMPFSKSAMWRVFYDQ